MKILIAGCWRSGTTALYNLVRLICEADGDTLACFSDRLTDESAEYKHVVVKAHKYSADLAEWADDVPGVSYWMPHSMKKYFKRRKLIFVTYREAREISASMRRFKAAGGKGNAADKNNLSRGLQYSAMYQEHCIMLVSFSYFGVEQSEKMLIDRIRQILGISCDVGAVWKRFRELQPPEKGSDPVTLLHSNHITQ